MTFNSGSCNCTIKGPWPLLRVDQVHPSGIVAKSYGLARITLHEKYTEVYSHTPSGWLGFWNCLPARTSFTVTSSKLATRLKVIISTVWFIGFVWGKNPQNHELVPFY